MYLGNYFEIILFSESSISGDDTIEYIDSKNIAMYRLFSDSMTKINGKQTKDISKINRPLEDVIMIESNPDYVVQKENTIIISKFIGDVDDQILPNLCKVLECI